MATETAIQMTSVMADMKKYRRFGGFLYRNGEMFNELPRAASLAAREMLTVDGTSKKKKQKLIMKSIRPELSLWRLAWLVWRGWRAVR